ncbi:FAD-dependent monooxygenase [Fodinicola acaciae]|uniref:FAD-dependent monooxygenase n=1 Tax=Fodinicola acaciae TaxID=2681555 RepID=UPI0013D111A8|nr:FAD-dependent monooxygenase [Fodinicola acaciae]
MRTVLISGAGIAGSTLAYWLARHGFRPTVVERAAGLRSSGNPVDVHGPATEIARRMGILPRLREAATRAPELAFVTASGRRIGPLRLGRPSGDDVEVPRADLATILTEAARDDTELIFGDRITTLRQDDHGVDVTFERAAPRRFDLVVGADGLHSAVRALAFGPEERFVRHLGLYIATLSFGRPAADPSAVVMYNRPGRSLAVHPVRGNAGAGFIFRGPAVDGRDPRQVVVDAYATEDWRVPELPDLTAQVRAADDLYFDSVSQVRLPAWSRGRVTLIGDAASCVSLFGDGSSLAMVGATTLAEALASNEVGTALRAYEAKHRRLASSRQRGFRIAAGLLVPKTSGGLAFRNLVTSALRSRS